MQSNYLEGHNLYHVCVCCYVGAKFNLTLKSHRNFRGLFRLSWRTATLYIYCTSSRLPDHVQENKLHSWSRTPPPSARSVLCSLLAHPSLHGPEVEHVHTQMCRCEDSNLSSLAWRW